MWQVDFTHYRLSRPDSTPGIVESTGSFGATQTGQAII